MQSPQDYPDRAWHLDKRVPIILIVTILIQTLALGRFIGDLDSRLRAVEMSQYTREEGAILATQVKNNERQIDRLEERTLKALDDIKFSLRNIERRLDVAEGRTPLEHRQSEGY